AHRRRDAAVWRDAVGHADVADRFQCHAEGRERSPANGRAPRRHPVGGGHRSAPVPSRSHAHPDRQEHARPDGLPGDGEVTPPNPRLTATDVLRRYKEEDLPEFIGCPLEDVHQVGNFGSYPINTAAVRGDLDELTALLDAGADVNAVGEHGCTPLQEAVGQGHEQAVRLLLARGAHTSHVDNWGHTALDIAILGERAGLIALLKTAHRQRRRVLVRRFASAAEADRHDVEYWRRLSDADRVAY